MEGVGERIGPCQDSEGVAEPLVGVEGANSVVAAYRGQRGLRQVRGALALPVLARRVQPGQGAAQGVLGGQRGNGFRGGGRQVGAGAFGITETARTVAKWVSSSVRVSGP